MCLSYAKETHGTIGHTGWSLRKSRLRREDTLPRLPEVIGEPSERGNLKTDQRRRETLGFPTRREPQGNRALIVPECLGQCSGQGEGVQGDEKVRDCAVEAANRQGISGQGRLRLRPGEPCALKGASTVREEVAGKGPGS
jgi:hypothetical protein